MWLGPLSAVEILATMSIRSFDKNISSPENQTGSFKKAEVVDAPILWSSNESSVPESFQLPYTHQHST